jgi:carboxypeptidase C (cathepsin A)
MSDQETKPATPSLGTGARTQHVYRGPRGDMRYTAVADWITLREHDEAIASLFFTAYLAELPEGSDRSTRPITFVFNGGPGSASVWLHLGLVGPRRLAFAENGGLLPPPAKLVDNPESWLPFTDIVCLDPIGTGFSRTHEHGPKPADAKPAEKAPDPSRFWEVERDLQSVSEAIARILTKEKRWLSPVALAGESYGGFRVARLARTLQEDHGVALSAAILVSPGIELSTLVPSDYGIEHYLELFPSFAATAHAHGRAGKGVREGEHREAAEAFAASWAATTAPSPTSTPSRPVPPTKGPTSPWVASPRCSPPASTTCSSASSG